MLQNALYIIYNLRCTTNELEFQFSIQNRCVHILQPKPFATQILSIGEPLLFNFCLVLFSKIVFFFWKRKIRMADGYSMLLQSNYNNNYCYYLLLSFSSRFEFNCEIRLQSSYYHFATEHCCFLRIGKFVTEEIISISLSRN